MKQKNIEGNIMRSEIVSKSINKIKSVQTSEASGIKSTLHLLGSMAIAYCLCTFFHELGHAFSYLVTGYHVRVLDVHPFSMNQCVPQEYGAKGIFQGLMGPLTNIIVGIIVFLTVWKFRKPQLLPLLLWGAFPFLEEGVGIFIEIILVYPQGGTSDWWFAVFEGGLPLFALGIIGGTFLLIGLFLFLLIMPLMGIRSNDSYLKKMVIIQGGMSTYFLAAFLYVLKFYPTIKRVKLAIFIASVLLVVIMVTMHRPLAKYMNNLTHFRPVQASWVTIGITLCVASVIIAVLMSTYHWYFI
jgi:hypothetical protein